MLALKPGSLAAPVRDPDGSFLASLMVPINTHGFTLRRCFARFAADERPTARQRFDKFTPP
jgi:DNA-binding IclR family transcriptional regulator